MKNIKSQSVTAPEVKLDPKERKAIGKDVDGYASAKQVKWLTGLMVGVIIVLFIGFVGIFMTYIQTSMQTANEKKNSYDSLLDKYYQQDIEINDLQQSVKSLKTSQKVQPQQSN